MYVRRVDYPLQIIRRRNSRSLLLSLFRSLSLSFSLLPRTENTSQRMREREGGDGILLLKNEDNQEINRGNNERNGHAPRPIIPASGYFRALLLALPFALVRSLARARARYIKLIKSPRLIGVHPYIRMPVIKFTGPINCAPLRSLARDEVTRDRRRGIHMRASKKFPYGDYSTAINTRLTHGVRIGILQT